MAGRSAGDGFGVLAGTADKGFGPEDYDDLPYHETLLCNRCPPDKVCSGPRGCGLLFVHDTRRVLPEGGARRAAAQACFPAAASRGAAAGAGLCPKVELSPKASVAPSATAETATPASSAPSAASEGDAAEDDLPGAAGAVLPLERALAPAPRQQAAGVPGRRGAGLQRRCQFSGDGKRTTPQRPWNAKDAAPANAAVGVSKPPICKHWRLFTCNLNGRCKFRHDGPGGCVPSSPVGEEPSSRHRNLDPAEIEERLLREGGGAEWSGEKVAAAARAFCGVHDARDLDAAFADAGADRAPRGVRVLRLLLDALEEWCGDGGRAQAVAEALLRRLFNHHGVACAEGHAGSALRRARELPGAAPDGGGAVVASGATAWHEDGGAVLRLRELVRQPRHRSGLRKMLDESAWPAGISKSPWCGVLDQFLYRVALVKLLGRWQGPDIEGPWREHLRHLERTVRLGSEGPGPAHPNQLGQVAAGPRARGRA
ncbi:unnamed protein product [Prorocentrum cordatum]|nr:unnamed protein product [Polarella glacialis]